MVVQTASGTYSIDFFDDVAKVLDALPPHAALVTDQNVAKCYPEFLAGRPTFVIEPGEGSKNWAKAGELVAWLSESGMTRKGPVLTFGGGVVGDLAGFAAATYMRGIPFVQIPTSLLAMVDSSIGGKVGVDLPQGKNLAGSFWPPQRVLLCPDFLKTLPEVEVSHGLAEMWKAAYIADPSLASQLTFPPGRDAIQRAIEVKKAIVEADEFELNGLRATLNFGHTLGHALEQVSNYAIAHGQAVAIGMVAEAKLGERLGITVAGTSDRLIEDLHSARLMTEWPSQWRNWDDLLSALRKDKKTDSGTNLAFAVLSECGACKLYTDIPAQAVKEMFESIS